MAEPFLMAMKSHGSKRRRMIGRALLNGKEMRLLIAGNWKMNGLDASLQEVRALIAGLKPRPGVAVVICPPATLVARVAKEAGAAVGVGGQDCHPKVSGAFTGEISAEMLKDAGATWTIVGHSERRQYQHESDELIAAKAQAGWRAGLGVMICIGETEAERVAGQEEAVVSHQLAHSVPADAASHIVAIAYEPRVAGQEEAVVSHQLAHSVPADAASHIVAIAYEQVWAIGTGRTPTNDDIAKMHRHIRKELVARFGGAGAKIEILYGGSVNPKNAKEILAQPEVGGALVGGASLKAVDFLTIIAAAP
jgi:triosephosphate isomerase (TIM)